MAISLVQLASAATHHVPFESTLTSYRRISEDWMPGKCRDDHYFGETLQEEIEHRKRHFRDCMDYWINSPTGTPTKSVPAPPTAAPTRSPTRRPTGRPSRGPSPLPTASPTPAPTRTPTASPSHKPSLSPTTSAQPTLLEFFEVALPEFEIELLFDKNPRRKLVDISDNLILDTLDIILSEAYRKKFPDFHVLDLAVGEKSQEDKGDSFVVTYPFSGGCVFTSDDPTGIPDENTLTDATMRAFLGEGVTQLLKSASDDSFSSLSVKKVGSTQVVSNKDTDITNERASKPTGTITLTIVASVVAVVSTLTALGLIFAQRRNSEQELTTNPSSNTKDHQSPKGIRKIMSPFPLASTPADGTRRYFSRLDDGSISSKSQTNGYLNPNISIVNSSFSKDEESSLEAPSMAGLSSICDFSKAGGESLKSLDGESYANMSALDEVRLGKVLDLEGSLTDENSHTTAGNNESKLERNYTFAKLWKGHSNKQKASLLESSSSSTEVNECTKLAPPANDSPTKKARSPVKEAPSETEPEPVPEPESASVPEESNMDEDSLVGNESDKESFCKLNDESNPLLSMLGDRSVNSMESESVDFNDMYAVESSSFDESSMGESSKMSSNM